jgi:triosephosphate isomerase
MARRGTPVRREGRRPLLAGNWKMNLTHLEAIGMVQKLAFSLKETELEAAEVVVLPPFTALRSVQTLVNGDKLEIGYGAQDLSVQDSGAYTGEVSGAMLAALACRYVVVGHSERRALHGEDDAVVAGKVQAALRHGLVPILCVGEGLEVRRAGEHVAHCTAQLDAALEGLTAEQLTGSGGTTGGGGSGSGGGVVGGGGSGSGGGVVIAYEPVWAIGTGEVATPEDAQEVCGALRSRLAERFGAETAGVVRILYGGSVKAANTAGILAGPDVDGALVGGASLDADEFAQICRTAADVG